MDNLHHELAPISGPAWDAISQEAARTFKRHLAGRRLVRGCRGRTAGA